MSNPFDAKKLRCRRRFMRYFPKGFRDERYLAWEREYKAEAHTRWKEQLSRRRFAEFLAAGQYLEVAVEALRIEARTNLLFSFEKMALRDAVRPADVGMMDVTNLRGIGKTSPYFHNNSAATLEEVLDHYEAFFRRVARVNRPPRLPAILSSDGVTIDRGFITPEERPALLAYLRKL